MNKKKLRERRYQNRQYDRNIDRQNNYMMFTNEYLMKNFLTYDDFLFAAKEASHGVKWKNQTMNYLLNIHINTLKLMDEIFNDNFELQNVYEFDINERGKERHITSYSFRDKVVFKTFNRILKSGVNKYTIVSNCASIPGRGYHYAIKMLKEDLSYHYRHNGKEGYIIRGDFKSYFDSIPHDKLLEQIDDLYGNKDLTEFISKIIKNDEGKGLSLGCELNQILAVQYPRKLDSFVTCQCHIKGYGRYMDDFYAICETREEAEKVLELIDIKTEEIGLKLNWKKTKIIKLTSTFKYLKNTFVITDTGKILVKIEKKSVKRMVRKLKKFIDHYKNGQMSLEDIFTSYISWRGFSSQKDCYKLICDVDKKFKKYFEDVIIKDIDEFIKYYEGDDEIDEEIIKFNKRLKNNHIIK